MTAHLAAGWPMPPEYLELVLCRDVYHCPPAQLPDARTVNRHLTCLGIEARLKRRG
jgi:hypothetical protein